MTDIKWLFRGLSVEVRWYVPGIRTELRGKFHIHHVSRTFLWKQRTLLRARNLQLVYCSFVIMFLFHDESLGSRHFQSMRYWRRVTVDASWFTHFSCIVYKYIMFSSYSRDCFFNRFKSDLGFDQWPLPFFFYLFSPVISNSTTHDAQLEQSNTKFVTLNRIKNYSERCVYRHFF